MSNGGGIAGNLAKIVFSGLDQITATIHTPISKLQSKCKTNRGLRLDAYPVPFSFPIEPCCPPTQKQRGPKCFTHGYDISLGLLNYFFLALPTGLDSLG